MKNKFCYLLSFLLTIPLRIGAEEPIRDLMAYDCKVEDAGLFDISIIGPGLYDSDGNKINHIHHGMAEFYIAEEQIILDSATLITIGDTLSKINEWKSAAVTPSESPVVGLHVKSTDFLIFHRNSWILVSVRNLNRVVLQVFEARLIIDRGKFKVFTRVPSKVPALSEDKRIIDIFWKLELNSSAAQKGD